MGVAGVVLGLVTSSGAMAAGSSVHGVVSVDPAGFLFFGPSVNVEFAVGERLGIGAGVRDLASGWAARYASEEEEGHELEQAVLYGLGARVYWGGAGRLQGWFAGPRVEFGQVTTDEVKYEYAGFLEAEFGRAWALANRLMVAASLQAGVGAGWENGTRLGASGSGTEYYPIGNLVLQIGYAL
jgi:hypothetical protein